MYQALCLSQTQAPGLHGLIAAIYLIISVSCIQVFSQTLYEHLRQDSFRQAKITKGINKLLLNKHAYSYNHRSLMRKKSKPKVFAHEIWTQNLVFWRDADWVLAKEICLDESCAFREGDISENGLLLPKEPKSYSCRDVPSDSWGLGRRNSPVTDPFRDIHQNWKEQRAKSAWESISAGLALLSLVLHIWGLLVLSQLACSVCSDCKRKSPSSPELASAKKQSAVLTSQEVFWFEKDIISQKETLDLKGSKPVQQSSTPASVFLDSCTSVDN